MDYFTSDLHIGHDRDFIYKSRGFDSIKDHDSAILTNWNNIVAPSDTVYILGDLCMHSDNKEWDRIYKKLNGHKKFIIGNHDTDNKIKMYIEDYNMDNLGLAAIFKYSKRITFYLSHYPTLVANKDDKRFFWNLSGHTHSRNKFQFGENCVYNVAMDAHMCTPVSIEQIIIDIRNYKQKEMSE